VTDLEVCIDVRRVIFTTRLVIDVSKYPPLLSNIAFDKDIEVICLRRFRYHQDRESLVSVANFRLTMIEDSVARPSWKEKLKCYSKRKKAAKRYRIELNVLDKIGYHDAITDGSADVGGYCKTYTTVPIKCVSTTWANRAVVSCLRYSSDLPTRGRFSPDMTA